MTVSTQTYKNTYSGDGSDTTFDFSFPVLDETHILVQLKNSAGVITDQTLTTHYTVSGTGNTIGATDYSSGTITFTSPPSSTETVVIKRNVPLTQATDYVENDPFPAETHEDALDKVTMQNQQQQEELDRSVKVDSAVSGFSDTLPDPVLYADKYLKYNAAGTQVEAVTLATLSTNSQGISYTASFTDSVERTVRGKLDDWVSVKDFGAVGDGSTDDTAALNLAFTNAGNILIPPGTYKTSSSKLKIRSNTSIIAYGASIDMYEGAFGRGVLIDAATDVTISGLTVNMKDTTSASVYYGISIQNSSRITLIDCKVQDPAWSTSKVYLTDPLLYYGFVVSQSTTDSLDSGTYAGDGSDDTACDDIKFIRCTAKGCYQYGYELFPKVASSNYLIEGCVAEDIGNSDGDSLNPAGFKVGQGVTGTIMTGCIVKTAYIGIIAGNWSHLVVSDNTVINYHKSALLFGANDHSYFDASTGGNSGTGHYTGTIEYTRAYCLVSGLTAFNESTFTSRNPNKSSGIGWFGADFTDNGPVIIQNCNIETPTLSNFAILRIESTAATPNIIIRDNVLRGRSGLYLTGTAALDAPVISGNIIENTATSTASTSNTFSATGALIDSNIFIGNVTYGMNVTGDGTRISNNIFKDINSGSVATSYPILINASSGDYYVTGNIVQGGVLDSFIFGNNSGSTIHSVNNILPYSLKVRQSSSTTLAGDEVAIISGGGDGMRRLTGTSAPASGTYAPGDIVYNESPSAAGNIGWVCISGGSPGTWKSFGTIAS